jgi:hypothetical protein
MGGFKLSEFAESHEARTMGPGIEEVEEVSIMQHRGKALIREQ